MNIPEKYKKIIPAAIAIVLVIAGIMYYNRIQNEKNLNSSFITEKDPNLTAEQRKIVEDRIAGLNEKIKNPPEGSTDAEKYNLYIQIGFQKLNLGKFSEARDSFIDASHLQPDNYAAYVALYQVYLSMTDYNSARESIKKAVSLSPGSPDVWRKYIPLEKEKFGATNEELEKLYSEALKSTGESIDILTVYAQFLEEKGDIKGAIEQWKKATVAYATNKDVYQGEIYRLENLPK